MNLDFKKFKVIASFTEGTKILDKKAFCKSLNYPEELEKNVLAVVGQGDYIITTLSFVATLQNDMPVDEFLETYINTYLEYTKMTLKSSKGYKCEDGRSMQIIKFVSDDEKVGISIFVQIDSDIFLVNTGSRMEEANEAFRFTRAIAQSLIRD